MAEDALNPRPKQGEQNSSSNEGSASNDGLAPKQGADNSPNLQQADQKENTSDTTLRLPSDSTWKMPTGEVTLKIPTQENELPKTEIDMTTSESGLPRASVQIHGDKPKVGDKFAGRYEILSVLGKGGMSTVYKSNDEKLNRIVALKVVHPHLMEEEDCIRRFEREAKSVGGLKHDHIVEIHTYDITETGFPYIIMEYLEGQALSTVVKNLGRVPYNRAVPIFMQIADALSHAHAKGIIHRDLKPSNVLLSTTADNTDSVGVVDFGLAKFTPSARSNDSSITATGQVFGSPPYMSPEQCIGKSVDERSDIYSLGCLMYEVLTGVPPFVAETPVATVMKQIGELPQPPSKVAVGANIPPLLEALILKSLDKDPKMRQHSMEQVLSELSTLVALEQSGLEFKPVTADVRVRMMWTHSRTALIIGVVVALVILYLIFSSITGWIDSPYDWEFRWLKIIVAWVVGIAAVLGAWRLRSMLKGILSPDINALVPSLPWSEPALSTSAQIESAKSVLHEVASSLEGISVYNDRSIHQKIRETLQSLLQARAYDDVESFTNYALGVLRSKQRENFELGLLFREFLADAIKAKGQSEVAEASYREIMSGWHSSDDFSRHVKSTVQLKLADALRAQKKYSEAQAIYSTSLPNIAAGDPFSAVHYGKLGDCYLSIDNFKLAAEQYQRVMNVADAASDKANSALGFIKYVYTCYRRWKPIDIKQDFARVVETIRLEFGTSSSHYFVATSLYANTMWNQKRFLEAINAYREATASVPLLEKTKA